MRTILFICALLLTACASNIQPGNLLDTKSQTPFNIDRGRFPLIGEKIVYAASLEKLRSEIADVVMQVQDPITIKDGRTVVPLSVDARSKSIVRLVADINDHAESYIDAKTWLAIYGMKDLDENGRKRSYRVWYWPKDLRASVERTHKGKKTEREITVPSTAMDSVAWFYYIRTIPAEQPMQISSFTYDGWTINEFSIHSVGEEKIWTELGFFQCYHYEVYRERSFAYQPMGALSGTFIEPERVVTHKKYHLGDVWITKDDKRLPVKISAKTILGRFQLLLKAYKAPNS